MIAVVGSVNMDLVVNIPEIPKVGETMTGGVFSQNPGGKGANQAVAGAKMGSQVAFVGSVGDDSFGETLKAGLCQYGVDVSHLETVSNVASGIALIQVDSHGRNNISVAPGANFEVTKEQLDRAIPLFQQAKIAVFQLEIPLEMTIYGMKLAKEAGCTVLLNPAPAQDLSSAILEHCDILVPNEFELSRIAKMPTESVEQIQEASRALSAYGVDIVLTTMGSRGVCICQGDICKVVPANKVTAVDTTAAGDAFLGGFAHQYEEDYDLEKAVIMGQKVAAYAVTKHGAQQSMPWKEEL